MVIHVYAWLRDVILPANSQHPKIPLFVMVECKVVCPAIVHHTKQDGVTAIIGMKDSPPYLVAGFGCPWKPDNIMLRTLYATSLINQVRVMFEMF